MIETYRTGALTGELMALLELHKSPNQRLLALTILDVRMQGRRGNDLASLQAHLLYRIHHEKHL